MNILVDIKTYLVGRVIPCVTKQCSDGVHTNRSMWRWAIKSRRYRDNKSCENTLLRSGRAETVRDESYRRLALGMPEAKQDGVLLS